jgi:hypothetical protein
MSNNRGARVAARIVAAVPIAVVLMWCFGHVPFAPWATDLLIRVASAVGIHGTEDIENFYMVTTAIVSVAVAAAMVTLVPRMGAQRQTD